jgi:hypothetical protein
VWTSTHDVAGAHAESDRHHDRRTATIRIHDGVVRGSFVGAGAVGAAIEPLVDLVVDIHTLTEILDEGRNPFETPLDVWQRRCGTTDGTTCAPGDLLAAMWTGHVRAVVVDHDVVVAMGRTRRLFTGRARHAVLLRAERCVWPGCDEPAGHRQADHQTEYQHGGTTDPANGAPLCGRHNRFKSANRDRVSHEPSRGRWHTHRADGSELR